MAIKVPVGYETDGAQLESEMTSDVKSASGKAGAAGGKEGGKKFSQSFKDGIKGALGAAGVVAGVGQAVDQIKKAIGGASDLVESSTKISAVFGEADDAVQKFAARGAKALGQTKQEALDAAATFGTFGKSAGLTGNDLAKFSTGLTGLSTDFSSFFNASPETAVEAIGAALRGESEPIRQFGILLDDATLKAEALSLGLLKPVKSSAAIQSASIKATEAQKLYNEAVSKSGKDSLQALKAEAALGTAKERLIKATEGTIPPLTQQQKVLAAQSSIFKQSKDAQGDFARTSGGLANQSRILRAQLIDVRTELGSHLLPIALKVTSGVSDLVTGFSEGSGAGGALREVLDQTGASLEVVFKIGKSLVGVFEGLPGPVKDTAVQLGVGVLVIRGLSIALTTLGTTATATAVRGLAATGSGLAALRTAAYATGAALRTVAGAGGIALFVSGIQEADQETKTLKQTLGGAAAGFYLGGPIGAAVGALGGFTTALINSDEATKQSKKELIDYGQVLDQISGKLKKGATDSIVADLQKNNPNVLKAGAALGFTPEQIAKYIEGNKKVQASLNATLDLARQVPILIDVGNGGQVDAFSILTNALNGATAATNEGKEASKGLVDQFVRAQADALITAGKLSELRLKVDGVTGAVKPAREQLKLLGGAYVKPKVDTSSIFDATNALSDFRKLFGLPLNKTANINIVPSGSPIGRKAIGGPVRAGVPYIVGERRPEVFVPNQSGRIEPDVGRYMSSVPQSAPASNLTIIQNDYGPRTGRAKINEIVWATKYATHARGYQGEAS